VKQWQVEGYIGTHYMRCHVEANTEREAIVRAVVDNGLAIKRHDEQFHGRVSCVADDTSQANCKNKNGGRA
jgi:hypothetical protein